MIYFAYGSNLSHQQIMSRCPTSEFLGPATLSEYKLIFSGYSPRWGSSVANIVKQEHESVSGGLFEMSDDDLNHLDILESSQGYTKINTLVNFNNKQLLAATFISSNTMVGKPAKSYLLTMEMGRIDCNIA